MGNNKFLNNDFNDKLKSLLVNSEPGQFALVSLDFDNFRYINDLYGYEYGDSALNLINEQFSNLLEEGEFFSQIYADNFAFLLKNINLIEKLNDFTNFNDICAKIFPSHYAIISCAGIYIIEEITEKFSSMFDKANYARKKSKGNLSSTFTFYNKELFAEQKWRKIVTLNMQNALVNKEFEMYLQPKVLLKSNKVIGAEALARWKNKELGFITPDRFIPILENNGFIKYLDFYILEEACLFLLDCKKNNIPMLPISVNFSRKNLSSTEFADKVFNVVNKHNIPTKFIEIELTESVFSEDFHLLVEIANKLKNYGFKVSIDDFGSAYSSLGTLKDLPVDIVKIDKTFLQNTLNDEKGKLIIAKILEMVKSLRMLAVMEGVETKEQVEFLDKLCCDIGQGYFYSRPLTVEDYKKYLKSKINNLFDIVNSKSTKGKKDKPVFEISNEFVLNNWEIYTICQNVDMGIIKNRLDGQKNCQYVNKRALEYFGYTSNEFKNKYNTDLYSFFHPDDLPIFKYVIEVIKRSKKTIPFQLRVFNKAGKPISIKGTATCILDSEGNNIGIYSFKDITKESSSLAELEGKYELKSEELNSVYKNLPGGVIRFVNDSDLTITYVNEGFKKIIGYSIKEMKNKFNSKLINFFSPEEFCNLTNQIKKQLLKNNYFKLIVKVKNKKNKFVWLLVQGQLSSVNGSEKELFCVILDATSEKENVEKLRQIDEKYKIIVEQSNDIWFEWDFNKDCIEFSDNFIKQFGYTPITENITSNKKIFDITHSDDHCVIDKWIKSTFKSEKPTEMEFRLITDKGKYVWLKSRTTTICDEQGAPIKALGVFSNIDKQKSAMETLKTKSQQDSLTKLYNKEETRVYVEQYLKNCGNHEKFAMIMVDIDNFKSVNDNLGHHFGDSVLVDIAKKLKNMFRGKDIVGRLGGDEFAIFMTDVTDEKAVIKKAKDIVSTLRISYYGDKARYDISGSVGISFYPKNGKTFEKLYKASDLALYASKNKGKNRYTIYTKTLKNINVKTCRTPLESDEKSYLTNHNDLSINNIFDMLYESKDTRTSINMVLNIIGKKMKIDRCYIFLNDIEDNTISNIYEWCNEGVTPQIENLQNLSLQELSPFFSNYNANGIFSCENTLLLDKHSYDIIEPQGVKALLHCGMFDEGLMRGFIGFDDCQNSRVWSKEDVETIGYISRILTIFTLKKQISKELWEAYQNYNEMLDNLNGFVYVINSDFEYLYINKAIKELGANLGEKCYEFAFGRSSPCVDCPAKKINNKTNGAISQIYSVKINQFVNSSASKLKWTDGKIASLICCTETAENKSKTKTITKTLK